ncbi:hypothetical protein FHS32_001169 [Streptomyces albaduncus]|uniref:Uncharacterized protein n=1 Tax=Streptomyces griseoloalbus TaxID=67303 RepID=A0A7W8F8J9_9ACTN|nr:hypothetical protein [Streptomyces albaduncus]GGW64019.1 hypothetical protein GCM10010340_47890 [Streptomyces albaduncus]
MPASEALVGGTEGRGDLAHDVHVLSADQGRAGAGPEHAGGGLVVVTERHGDAAGGEGRDGEEAAALDVGATQVGDREDGVGFRRLFVITGLEANLGLGDGAPRSAGQRLGQVLTYSARRGTGAVRPVRDGRLVGLEDLAVLGGDATSLAKAS